MVILFTPWRHVEDLTTREESWSEMYNNTCFSGEVLQIIRNLQVENECEDTKHHVSDMSVALPSSEGEEWTNHETEVDIDSLQLLLSHEGLAIAEEANISLEHNFVIQDAEKASDVLTELERANLFDLSGMSTVKVNNNVQICSDDTDVTRMHYARFMASIKKHK